MKTFVLKILLLFRSKYLEIIIFEGKSDWTNRQRALKQTNTEVIQGECVEWIKMLVIWPSSANM